MKTFEIPQQLNGNYRRDRKWSFFSPNIFNIKEKIKD